MPRKSKAQRHEDDEPKSKSKSKRPQSAWIKHLLAVKKAHKGMSLGEAMKEAKKTYKKK